MKIREFKRTFDVRLARALDGKLREIRLLTGDPFILDVASHAKRLLLAGGKRIRPYLAYVTYRSASRKSQVAKPENELLDTLVALELFHMFALVHDDIMDKGLKRHGVTTTHRIFDESQAILLGDLLHAWAGELVSHTPCASEYAAMAQEVIVGQMIDVEVASRRSVSTRLIFDKMRLKTASYSFIRPMLMGQALAGGGTRRRSSLHYFCEAYGLPLGLGFQIQDDLFDLTLSAKQLGKTPFSDLRDGQHTVFTDHIFRRGSSKQIKALRRLMHAKLSEKDRPRVRRLFMDSGALDAGRKMMETYFRQAAEAVNQSGLSPARAKPFKELVQFIRGRSS